MGTTCGEGNFGAEKGQSPLSPEETAGFASEREVGRQVGPSNDDLSSRGGNMPPNAWKSMRGGLIEDYATWPIVHAVEVPKYSSKALRSYVSLASSLALDMTKSLV